MLVGLIVQNSSFGKMGSGLDDAEAEQMESVVRLRAIGHRSPICLPTGWD